MSHGPNYCNKYAHTCSIVVWLVWTPLLQSSHHAVSRLQVLTSPVPMSVAKYKKPFFPEDLYINSKDLWLIFYLT